MRLSVASGDSGDIYHNRALRRSAEWTVRGRVPFRFFVAKKDWMGESACYCGGFLQCRMNMVKRESKDDGLTGGSGKMF